MVLTGPFPRRSVQKHAKGWLTDMRAEPGADGTDALKPWRKESS
jgi:hypothetical protein